MHRPSLLTALPILAIAACSRQAPQPLPEPPPVAAVATAPASASASASASARPPAAGALADAYQGSLDPDLAVFMRLSRDPATGGLHGRYFYASKGIDITLTGVLAPDNSFTLDEISGKKKTGTFTGAIASDGALHGTWADPSGKNARPFLFHPVPRNAAAPALIGKKQYHARYRVKDYDGPEPPYQILDMAAPELFGLADAAVEARINERLDHERREDSDMRRMIETYKSDYTVWLDRDGVLSLTFYFDDSCTPCAYPAYGGKSMNISLATGDEIPLDKLFVKGGKAKLAAVAEAAYRKQAGDEFDEYILSQCLEGDYTLSDKGLHLIAYFRLPHVSQGLDPGLTIPYASLDKALDPKSPAAGAWSKP
jgi:hypothetical protein